MPITANDEIAEVEVPGCKPYVFTRDMFTCDGAWEWFWAGKELDEDAFIHKKDWRAYFLLSLKLTEGTVCIYGDERSGKTLVASYLSYVIRDTFAKKVTANYYLKKEFGAFEYLDPASEFQAEMDIIAAIAKEEKSMTDEQLFEALKATKLYNRIVIIDEAHEVVAKDRRTNLSRALGSMNRLYGHLHNLTLYLSQDKRDFDDRMVWSRRTHEIVCGYESFFEETCTYIVKHRRTSMTKMMHLQPADWSFLWKSTNIRGLATQVKIKL